MKIPFIALIFSLASLSASAQIERKPAEKGIDSAYTSTGENKADQSSRKDRMKELNLTREQMGKIKELRQSGKEAREAVENNDKLSAEEKKKQLRDLKKSQMQKMQTILTPEQFEKFKVSSQNNP
jgi:Spy/CpxP family protein refolding chaperone